MKKEVRFKPRARLLLQLGEQLIKNEKIAMLELVKNAYDADSSKVDIIMENIDNKDKACMVIEDDGVGMDFSIITNEWMEPGSDFKKKLYESGTRTSKYGRLPLGEKGIGRFAAHKLGDKIELITRKANNPEIVVKFKWESFSKEEYRYLDDVPITIEEREPVVFKGKQHGTQITISKLRKDWKRGEIRELHRALNSLCSPFDKPESFHVNFFVLGKEEWLEDLFTWEDAQAAALWKFRCKLSGSKITEFKYEFTPWKTMDKLSKLKLTDSNPEIKKKLQEILDPDERKVKPINISELGDIVFEGLIFDSDTRILKYGLQDIRGLKNYLKENSGIRIYRDGIRVYDYGEKGTDWLNLDLRRVNIPTRRISNNLIIGAVTLDRESSGVLREKTNREGFIENEHYEKFVKAVVYALSLIESLRAIDKAIMRKHYSPSEKTEPVLSTLADLRNIAEKSIDKENVRKKIEECIDKIERDYSDLNERLLKSAGAGLSLAIVVHEFEKIVDSLKVSVRKRDISDDIRNLVDHLAQLIEGYTALLRIGPSKENSLKTIINQAIFNENFRIKLHNIEVINAAENYSGSDIVKCSKPLIVTSLMNLIDNSIWWLDYSNIKEKKIFIDILDHVSGYLYLVLADNGLGFTLPREQLILPFISDKHDGMGLGLHIVDEVMKAHEASLIFPEESEMEVPEEFKKGAIIALVFKEVG